MIRTQLILRIIQKNGEYYNSSNYLISPDGKIFADRIRSKFSAWVESGVVDPSNITASTVAPNLLIKTWAEESKQLVDELFKKAGIKPIEDVDSTVLAKKVIEDIISGLVMI